MEFADVAVDAPVEFSRTFTYRIPSRFNVQPGQLVWVPFGARTLRGIVVRLSDTSPVAATRDILQPVEPGPLLDDARLELGQWVSHHYRCSLYTALAPMLPSGFETQVVFRYSPSPDASLDTWDFRSETVSTLAALEGKSRLTTREAARLLGSAGLKEADRLVEQGVLEREATLPRPQVSPRYEMFLLPTQSDGGETLPARQKALWEAVKAENEPLPARLANKEFGSGVADALFAKGLLAMEWLRSSGGLPPMPESSPPELVLSPEQERALAEITKVLEDSSAQPRSFLLHGVTGSGKTEVYLRAIDHVVRRGQRALFLVPEISLTPQTLERLNAWFAGRVALLHSRLTPRQQFDQWWGIRGGAYDVVVGPRSALFAPLDDLGLIVVDEEHEWTYKQDEIHPLYHARTAATELSRLTGAAVVLGSATPDVETYFRATEGPEAKRGVRLLELPRRVSGSANGDGPNLATVEVCDMRRELREGNRNIFSRSLASGLAECVGRGEQAILFLNRRGASSMVQCRDCGHVVTCRSCSVSLVYHSAISQLLCHRCNRRRRVPESCPECRGRNIRLLGVGTERVAEEVSRLLPGTRVERLDADVARSAQRADDVLHRLSTGETQVLVGTQMVAKGLDVPNVTVVGVVLADIGLFLPDFRSGERVFSLLCQVAGRAGRGAAQGRVYVQTYNPDHYAIRAAAWQEYRAMYDREIAARYESGNPPFNDLVHILYQGTDPRSTERQAVSGARELRRRARAYGRTDVEVAGPSPGIPQRVRGRFRWRVLLRGRGLASLLEGMDFPPGCTVDVDPVHVI